MVCLVNIACLLDVLTCNPCWPCRIGALMKQTLRLQLDLPHPGPIDPQDRNKERMRSQLVLQKDELAGT